MNIKVRYVISVINAVLSVIFLALVICGLVVHNLLLVNIGYWGAAAVLLYALFGPGGLVINKISRSKT